MVIAQLVCGPRPLLLGPGELSYTPFGALFGLNLLFDFLDDEACLKVVVGSVFLYVAFGYGGISQSLHQDKHYHLVRVGGLTHG